MREKTKFKESHIQQKEEPGEGVAASGEAEEGRKQRPG